MNPTARMLLADTLSMLPYLKERFGLRRVCLLLLGVGLLAGCQPFPIHPSNQEQWPLLLITLDTLRADRLGAYGYDRPTSPTLDEFAKTATLFRDVTCSMPTTLPSHLTIFTGLSPSQHGVTRNGMVPAEDLVSIFDLLGEQGIPNAAVVSAQVLSKDHLQGLGLEKVFFGDAWSLGASQIRGDAVTRRAEAWISEQAEQPFALWLHYFDPHEPYDPDPSFAQPFVAGYGGPLGNSLATEWLVSLNDQEIASRLTARDQQHVSDLYDAEIAFLDAQLGQLFAFLKTRGLWERMLVIIVADHGQAHGEQAFWGHGERLLEPVVKVPLLIKLPHQDRGHTVSEPIQTLDIVPTLADFLGIETPAGCTGRSLLPALQGGELETGPLRVVERRVYPSTPIRRGIALFGQDWKLTYYREAEGSENHLGRLTGRGGLDGQNFFTPEAPGLRLLKEILARQPNLGETPSSPLSPEKLEMLRSLGYVQ